MNRRATQNQRDTGASTTNQEQAQGRSITPELVREVADRVYALLKKDLQIERERMRGLPDSRQNGGHRW